MHDGGVIVNIYQNKKVICKSNAEYGMGGGHAHGRRAKDVLTRRDGPASADGKAHIRLMTTCSSMGPIKKGDQIFIDAVYDFQKHEGMKSKAGAYTEVMGIAILYAAAEPETVK